MHAEKSGLEQLCLRVGIESIPASWSEAWSAYTQWAADGKCELVHWELPPNAAEVFDLPAGSLPVLEEICKAIRGDEAFRELADFWHYLVYHLPGGMERYTNVWGLPDEILGYPTRLFSLAAMVSGADHALANFAATGVSDEVAMMTLGYIGYYTRDIRKKRGVWGLESLGWLSNYARALIFRLGRLTFKEGKLGLRFLPFKNRSTGELIAFCPDSSRFRADGLADGTNGINDPDAWTATLQIGGDTIVGHPVKDCIALREPITIPARDWEPAMAPGDDIVEVHIAGGSKMLHEDCIDAYRQAIEFFPRYYPDRNFRGFTCWSWLLDPGLAEILPADSNIVKFQQDFYLLPVPSNEAQCYDLVFGDSGVDPTKLTPTTQLQRAIIDRVVSGKHMRGAAGFITWEQALAMISG
jgi:hypothetical protein